MNKSFEKRAGILVTDKVTGEVTEVSTIVECEELTGMSKYQIRCSLNNPDHYTHKPLPVIGFGVYKYTGRHSRFDFAYVARDYVCELWCCDEGNTPCKKFYSHHKCMQFLGLSKSAYYRRMGAVELGEPHPTPILATDGHQWIIVFTAPKKEIVMNK